MITRRRPKPEPKYLAKEEMPGIGFRDRDDKTKMAGVVHRGKRDKVEHANVTHCNFASAQYNTVGTMTSVEDLKLLIRLQMSTSTAPHPDVAN